MDTIAASKLTQEGAMKILQASLQKARTIGVGASIAIVDDGGHLLAFSRTDHARLYTIPVAIAKGRGAALTRFPTGKKSPTGKDRDDHHSLAITLAVGPGSFVTIPGGIPISVNGHFVGAVGVSGGVGEQDLEIAQAGVAALQG